jgi:hypothetical protein
MSAQHPPVSHALQTTNLADLLERVLDKGIVITGDIRVKLVDIELLTVQLRLLICSVDKARELGIDWWTNHPAFTRGPQEPDNELLARIDERLAKLETVARSTKHEAGTGDDGPHG